MTPHQDLEICSSAKTLPPMASTTSSLPREFETDRALLRPLRFSDVDDVFAYATDPAFARYVPLPRPYLREHAEEFLARTRLADWSRSCTWAIVPKGLDRVMGSIRLDQQPEHRKADLGWGLAQPLWGQGLTTEVVGALIDLAFRTLPDLRRIEAHADQRNYASLRVAEKLGMTREGVLHSFLQVHDEPVDVVMFGLLRAAWTKNRG